jgi:hypothetical protein
MLVSAVLGTLLVPALYVAIQKLSERGAKREAESIRTQS